MAIEKVDRDSKYMKEMWGTTRLVTDYVPLERVTPTRVKKNDPPEDRLSKFCGGKGGFDDYAEWLT